jgi:hypothetical protein
MSHIYSSPTKPRLLSSAVAVACCLLPFQTASAYSLQDILRDALISDPIVREAKATQEAAQSTTKATRARHYPVVTLTGTKVLAQHNKYNSNDMDDGIGVRGSVNIYSWGAIEAAVRRDRSREEYYQHKYTESQEQLGSDIGRLYLSALRAKETLILNEQTLARHNNLLKDLDTIVKYDAGRRSELIEARARQLQVANIIAQQRRTMDLALSRLSRYTSRQLTANDLEDPFKNDTAKSITERFNNPNRNNNPSYQAQLAERDSVRADLDASKAERLPALNLEGSATRNTRQLYLNVAWNMLDIAARHNVERNAKSLIAAEAKSEQILRDMNERVQTSAIDMQESEQRTALTAQHIAAQKEVIKVYELQFKIARRTLTDVLSAYSELSSIEQDYVAARNDFRDAALDYLNTQAKISAWVGLAQK